MFVSPLLPTSLVEQIYSKIKGRADKDDILGMLQDQSLEEKIHILRFLLNKATDCDVKTLYAVWHTLISQNSEFNTPLYRNALDKIGKWWEAFESVTEKSKKEFDDLERSLDVLATTDEGKKFFEWVALSPAEPKYNGIWDEHRRGAIICIGKYYAGKEKEVFLVHHLDDWNTIQIEVVQILAAMKSRILVKVAPWYIEHDDILKPIIGEYL